MKSEGIFFLKDVVQDIRGMLVQLQKRKQQTEMIDDCQYDLDSLKKKVCRLIDAKNEQIEARKCLPKARLPVFNTDKPDSYLDFKSCIEPQLIYGSEMLNLSTLISCITGSQKERTLELIRHKDTVRAVFAVLDRKYGSIEVSQAQLLKNLR